MFFSASQSFILVSSMGGSRDMSSSVRGQCVFLDRSCISYFCWVELFSNPLLLEGSRFAMFSQVEEDFDDVFTVGAVLIFLPEEGFFVTKTFTA